MVLKEEQEKLKKLLSEAIPLLCKNGVHFKEEFSIEALVGITLDRDKVMLVSINETVRSDLALQEADSQLEEAEEDFTHETTLEHRPKATSQRRKRKTPGKHSIRQAESPLGDSNASADNRLSHSNNELEYESQDKKLRLQGASATVVKREPGLEGDPEEDLVFVKEDSADMDLGGMLAMDQQQQLSFPNVSLSGQQQKPGTSQQGAPIPIATFQNTTQVATGSDGGESSSQADYMDYQGTPQAVSGQLGHFVQEGEHYCKERLPPDPTKEKQSDTTCVFKCLLCQNLEKPFSHPIRSRLREHVLATHFNMAMYHCERCGKRFKHDSSYYRHSKLCKVKKVVAAFPSYEPPQESYIVDDETGKTLHKL